MPATNLTQSLSRAMTAKVQIDPVETTMSVTIQNPQRKLE